MAVNKVVFGAVSIMDISDSTVTKETLAEGVTAYDKSGEKITGTMKPISDLLETTIVHDTLLWDGNKEGKTAFDMLGDGTYTYYLVSENVLSLDDLKNGLILESSDLNGNPYEVLEVNDFTKMTNKIIASRSYSSLLFVIEDNAPLYAGTIAKKGIYFLHSEEFDGYVSRIQIPGYAGFNTEVEVLKKKYLPDHEHSWDDITENPIYNGEVENEEEAIYNGETEDIEIIVAYNGESEDI